MNWMDVDFNSSIRDFEYTKRVQAEMNTLWYSDEFDAMDSTAIFNYLKDKMEIVIFADYLKRYIYEKAEIEIPFRDITDEDFHKIITQAFTDNRAPFSFQPTTRVKSVIVKGWLTKETQKRYVVFLLGFGLRMPPEDVSEFLTKVINEEDFNFCDPFETICWFCYSNKLCYADAKQIHEDYEKMAPAEMPDKAFVSMSRSPKLFLLNRENLYSYLAALKTKEKPADLITAEFSKLYERSLESIAEERNENAADLAAADIESVLYSGVPLDEKGNLQKMSDSVLGKLFEGKRLSGQRMSRILTGKDHAERFDLITLLFLIYAIGVEPDWPTERCTEYIDEINGILSRCGLMGIYPVNPYECFVLMCLVTEYPLDSFAEIWEMSYGK